MDPIKHKVLDILYSRKSACWVEYFKSLDKSKYMNVKYFSCDMNKTFIDMAKAYFPNAKIVVDRYHFMRQVYWALDDVRKDVQKSLKGTISEADTSLRRENQICLKKIMRHLI